jgi:hypothetical protein
LAKGVWLPEMPGTLSGSASTAWPRYRLTGEHQVCRRSALCQETPSLGKVWALSPPPTPRLARGSTGGFDDVPKCASSVLSGGPKADHQSPLARRQSDVDDDDGHRLRLKYHIHTPYQCTCNEAASSQLLPLDLTSGTSTMLLLLADPAQESSECNTHLPVIRCDANESLPYYLPAADIIHDATSLFKCGFD